MTVLLQWFHAQRPTTTQKLGVARHGARVKDRRRLEVDRLAAMATELGQRENISCGKAIVKSGHTGVQNRLGYCQTINNIYYFGIIYYVRSKNVYLLSFKLKIMFIAALKPPRNSMLHEDSLKQIFS